MRIVVVAIVRATRRDRRFVLLKFIVGMLLRNELILDLGHFQVNINSIKTSKNLYYVLND